MKMKASTSTASLLFAMIIMVVAHPLSTWAHQDDSVSVNTASASESTSGVAILRGVKTDQEERNLAKGGNKPSKNDPPPPPTAAVTPSPTPAPAVVTPAPTIFPVVPYPNSCGTRSPVATTSTPTPAPTNEVQCTNPKNCNHTPCCSGFNCNAKKCEADNVRHLRERKLPFEKPTTEERKLAVCPVPLEPKCNIHNNEPLCGDDIPINAPAPSFCNYDDAPIVTTCTQDSLCCEDGNGGYYYGLTCWNIYIGGTCCPKGYARSGSGCIPLNAKCPGPDC